MNNNNKRNITAVLVELSFRDPDWKHVKMLPKFKELYQAWAWHDKRKHSRSHSYHSIAWKRNWLEQGTFEEFRKYALQ